MTYEQIVEIINSIQTEYLELESDMYDAGSKRFQLELLHKLIDLKIKNTELELKIELENYNDVQSQKGN
jgi:hypothetical protein